MTSGKKSSDLNLQSTVRATRAAVPHMSRNGGGSIIHIASVFGREAGGGPPYMTTKAAVIAHAKSLALCSRPRASALTASRQGPSASRA